MKKIYTTLFSVFVALAALAQAPPQGINYQAVAVDAAGKEIVGIDAQGIPIAGKAISVRFGIISGRPNGTLQYEEEHSTNTDRYGLFNLTIGYGTPTAVAGTAGTFDKIDWGSGPHYLKVEVDIKGGSDYKLMSLQQLMSVPYALYVKRAAFADSVDIDKQLPNSAILDSLIKAATDSLQPGTDNQTLTLSNDTLYIERGNYVTLTGIVSQIAGALDSSMLSNLNLDSIILAQTIQNIDSILQYSSTLDSIILANSIRNIDSILIYSNTLDSIIINTVANSNYSIDTAYIQNDSLFIVNGNGNVINAGSITDADSDPTNELQTLSINGNVISLSDSGGSVVFVETDSIYSSSPAAGIDSSDIAAWNQNGNDWKLNGNSGTDTSNFIGTTDAQDWIVKTNNSERIRVTSAGNIGIGTNSPTEKIEILNGNMNVSSPNFDANSLYGPGRIELYRGLNASSPHINGYIDFKDTITEDYDFRVFYSNPSALSPFGGLVFSSGPAASFINRMAILNNGNIGIGTTNPLGKFHINNDVSGADSSFVVTESGNVGIGTNSPTTSLHILGNTPYIQIESSGSEGSNLLLRSKSPANAFRPLGVFAHDETSQTEWFFGRPYGPNSGQSDRFVIQRNNTATHAFLSSAILNPSGNPTTTNRFFVVRNNGFVGINTDSPDQLLSVNGNASKAGGGSWATFSDKRVKQDIRPFDDGLKVLLNLKPVTYRYNEKSGYNDLNKTFVGFIAQDVEKVAPYMVNLFDDSKGPSGLNDKRQFDESALNKILVNAVKEQQMQIEQLKKELEETKSLIQELKKN